MVHQEWFPHKWVSGLLIVGLGLALTVLPILTAGSVGAQDGNRLSEEEQTLLDRVLAVDKAANGYTSYVLTETRREISESAQQWGENWSQDHTAVDLERTLIVAQSEQQKNILATMTARVNSCDCDPIADITACALYTLTAEARRVNGRLYVNVVRDVPDEQDIYMPVLPNGWIVIGDLKQYYYEYSELLDGLGVNDLLDNESGSLLDEQVKDDIMAVTLESTTLEDGTPVDRIALTMNADALEAFLNLDTGDEDPPVLHYLVRAPGCKVEVKVVYVLGPGDIPLAIERRLRMELPQTLMNGLLPEDMLGGYESYKVRFDQTQTTTISQINEPVEPATVPIVD
jgi:hypothetical protein